MDIAMNMEFWSDVGMTVAARLSLVALILWATRMMIDARLGNRRVFDTGPAAAPAPMERPAEAPIAKRREPKKPNVLTLRRPDGERAAVSGDRERMRKQLLSYLEERTARRSN